MSVIKIENYYEVLALHKCLMEVKFSECSVLPEAQGSPFTASMAFKIFEALVSISEKEGNSEQAKSWKEWQKADSERRETKLLVQLINRKRLANHTLTP